MLASIHCLGWHDEERRLYHTIFFLMVFSIISQPLSIVGSGIISASLQTRTLRHKFSKEYSGQAESQIPWLCQLDQADCFCRSVVPGPSFGYSEHLEIFRMWKCPLLPKEHLRNPRTDAAIISLRWLRECNLDLWILVCFCVHKHDSEAVNTVIAQVMCSLDEYSTLQIVFLDCSVWRWWGVPCF